MSRRRPTTLPREVQHALACRAAAGDRRAAEQLILASRGFILQRVRRLGSAALKDDASFEDDLYSEACRGMFEALCRYQPDRGIHPLTYCAYWIDLRIRNALSQTAGPASVGSPQHWRAIGKPRTTGVMLDDPAAEGLTDSDPSALDTLLAVEEVRVHVEALRDALKTLEPVDRRILELRYLGNSEPRPTLTAVGCAVGLSRERTRQREIEALKQLLQRLGVSQDRLSAVRG